MRMSATKVDQAGACSRIDWERASTGRFSLSTMTCRTQFCVQPTSSTPTASSWRVLPSCPSRPSTASKSISCPSLWWTCPCWTSSCSQGRCCFMCASSPQVNDQVRSSPNSPPSTTTPTLVRSARAPTTLPRLKSMNAQARRPRTSSRRQSNRACSSTAASMPTLARLPPGRFRRWVRNSSTPSDRLPRNASSDRMVSSVMCPPSIHSCGFALRHWTGSWMSAPASDAQWCTAQSSRSRPASSCASASCRQPAQGRLRSSSAVVVISSRPSAVLVAAVINRLR